MDRRKISHDILNLLERLRIMDEMLKNQNFKQIPEEELKQDLKETLEELRQKYDAYFQ